MAKSNKFGTFGGVFTPSILTILGVIMYLRLPAIIGQSGLFATLGIILVAHLISATTGLSVSAIATDKRVKAGGTYYMISRSLGLPIGGTLGLALFVGLSFSVSLYLIGFAESFLGFWGWEASINNIRITGSIVLLAVTVLTFISTSFALKMQYFIMAAIVLSLISIVFGSHEYSPATPFLSNPDSPVSLMVMFAIFFPAVTGFEAGVSMSGDLKDPKKSIPVGTIMAIGVGLLVYILLTFFFSYTVDSEVLANDPNVLLNIAWIPELVVAGIWGATLSSALGSILGAPRILQATAADKITPRLFAKGYGATNEPRNALLLTFVIAEAGILIGELDVIARVVSIFFITTYGFLNLSAAFETLTSADFRPSFKVPAWISLLGAAACIIVMIQLDILAMIGASVVLGGLYMYLKRRELTLRSGDAWSSIWSSLVRAGINKLNRSQLQSRNWRPNIILFSGKNEIRPHLINLGKSIAGRFGLISAFELVVSNEPVLVKDSFLQLTEDEDSGFFMHRHKCRGLFEGMDEIMRVYGFTGIEPNTVLMGWSRSEQHKADFLDTLKKLKKNNYSGAFLVYNHKREFGDKKNLDIWWTGRGKNLAFAINIIRHLSSSKDWSDPKLRLFVTTRDNTQSAKLYRAIEDILEQYRMDIEIRIVDNSFEKLSRNALIIRESEHTDLTLIGLHDRQYQRLDEVFEETESLAEGLGSFIYINASDIFDDHEVVDANKEARGDLMEDRESFALPALHESRYPLIAQEIRKIDDHFQKTLTAFNKEVFLAYYGESQEMLAELSSLGKAVFSNLKQADDYEDTYRQSRAISRAKNEFYFRSRRLMEGLLDPKLKDQRVALDLGIKWYQKVLEQGIARFPRHLSIPYHLEDFKLNKGDSFSLTSYKLGQRISHPFARKTISCHIPYREIAAFFLRDSRYHFLSALLRSFQTSTYQDVARMREYLLTLENKIDLFGKNLSDPHPGAKTLDKIQEEADELLNQLGESQKTERDKYCNRVLFESRRNLERMSREMESLPPVRNSRKKGNGKKFYRKQREFNSSFSETWQDTMTAYLNRVYLDLLVRGSRSRVGDELADFLEIISQRLLKNFSNRVQALREAYQSKIDDVDELIRIRSELGTREDFGLSESFEDLRNSIRKLTENLPEEIRMGAADPLAEKEAAAETIEVPLRRMTLHYLEYLLIGPAREDLERASENLNAAIFKVKDQVSFLRFRFENIALETRDTQDPDQIHPSDVGAEIENTLKEIEEEEEKVAAIREDFSRALYQRFDQAFEPLSSYKIAHSTETWPYLLREYQGKRALSKIGILARRLRLAIRRKAEWLLYSKSEGVLLARGLIDEAVDKNSNNKLLDLVDQLSPLPSVYQALPYYYKNLFSGRSAISEEYWIERPAEQEQFARALRRYEVRKQGGILVLGERNSGKTALCNHILKKHVKKEKLYRVTPPQGGSPDVKEFTAMLRSATGLHGDAQLVMDTLPLGAVLLFNDIELWWEQNDEGTEVIRLLLDLIANFGGRHLFVLNMNPHAYAVINDLLKIENYFIGSIACKPFDGEQLKELILRRHQSSGLSFVLGNKAEEEVSPLRLARLFNASFGYSRGNPGQALNGWVANITRQSGEVLTIQSPVTPDLSILTTLSDDWLVLLTQFVLHKRVTIAKLQRILGESEAEVRAHVLALTRTGLVIEKVKGVFLINTNVNKYMADFLQEEELI